MHFTNTHKRILARAMLGLVLFAQGIVATHACVMATAIPEQVLASAVVVDASQNEKHQSCHEHEAGNKNACLVHCSQANQINADQVTPLLMMPSTAVLVLDIPAIDSLILPGCKATQVLFNSGPPLSIRFCTFLI